MQKICPRGERPWWCNLLRAMRHSRLVICLESIARPAVLAFIAAEKKLQNVRDFQSPLPCTHSPLSSFPPKSLDHRHSAKFARAPKMGPPVVDDERRHERKKRSRRKETLFTRFARDPARSAAGHGHGPLDRHYLGAIPPVNTR